MRAGIVATLVLVAVGGSATPVFAVDSTIGVRGLPSGSFFRRDFNGDGVLTDADVVLQLLDTLGPGPDPDADGDGVLTAADTLAAVEKILLASCSDVDTSGAVDHADLDTVSVAVLNGAVGMLCDVNLDGLVDGHDILIVMDNVGMPPDELAIWPSTSEWLAAYLQAARSQGPAPLWASQADTPEHHRELSDEWDHGPGHTLTQSRKAWPPNHMLSYSRDWPTDSGQPPHTTTLSRLWPSSHRASVSREWDQSHDRLTSYREDVHWTSHSNSHMVSESYQDYHHSPDNSGKWETLHSVWYSQRWRSTPNHTRRMSYLWDPDGPGHPDDHSEDESRRWPANHERFYSDRDHPIVPRVHAVAVTQEWRDFNHHTFVSSGWPPMHYRYYSGTWNAHDIRYSIVFPPNHHGLVSSSWPQRILPGQWPPNHLSTISNAPGMPPPPLGPADWPLWPQDHNWFTTIREIITLPGDMTNPFPPAGGS
ncbi:MAG: hypothetical protein HBSAPP03_07420 [Phycisphaerae bacterium]|nr:MAG: hypothetical protein HBSAPP03_07420 [Phycisphaerae bacterium]